VIEADRRFRGGQAEFAHCQQAGKTEDQRTSGHGEKIPDFDAGEKADIQAEVPELTVESGAGGRAAQARILHCRPWVFRCFRGPSICERAL
jgi:hypothetical protein